MRRTTPMRQASNSDGPPRKALRALSDDGGDVGEELADKIAGLRIADISYIG
ncbi:MULTISPECIES: hypothetical protein [Variovorax]|uniref:hypothetical protein n=1 Tax=Variovorax TaxID=34072 RepID=UPI001F266B70|nr:MULTISPECIES: hypothetical protein [Variovorax]UKI12028.1 hypothetical protein L3V85_10160 [Variovorax paradoxus]